MGTKIKLKAADGHELDAYFAESSGPARGAIVLIQEIFGVNSHIRSVADDYASSGLITLLLQRCLIACSPTLNLVITRLTPRKA